MKDTVILKKDCFYYNNAAFRLEDIMDVSFYDYSNSVADEYKCSLYTCNELYFTFIHKALALKRYFMEHSVKKLVIKKSSFEATAISIGVCRELKIELKYSCIKFALRRYASYIISFLNMVASAAYIFYMVFPLKYMGKPDTDKNIFSIVRLNQEYQKFEFLRKNKDILFDYENIKSTLEANTEAVKQGTVYNRFKKAQRTRWLIKAFACSFAELLKIRCFVSDKVNLFCACAACEYHSKRVVHTLFYGEMINAYFSLFKNKQYITGKIIDRYAAVETAFAKKYNIKIINCPHGIEYGFKLPMGLAGDLFYATSAYAADYFNSLYKTSKFVFNENIEYKMLNRGFKNNSNARNIVFFSEAHEPEVNMEILEGLLSAGLRVTLKPHPREALTFYEGIRDKITVEKDFARAITGNICIARRSTVLIEALYNCSVPLAILTNKSDYSVYKYYPSLCDEKIKAFYKIEDLSEYIKEISKNG